METKIPLKVRVDEIPNDKGQFTIFIVRGTDYVAVMSDLALAEEFVGLYNANLEKQ